jgi:hypothetical protein
MRCFPDLVVIAAPDRVVQFDKGLFRLLDKYIEKILEHFSGNIQLLQCSHSIQQH